MSTGRDFIIPQKSGHLIDLDDRLIGQLNELYPKRGPSNYLTPQTSPAASYGCDRNY